MRTLLLVLAAAPAVAAADDAAVPAAGEPAPAAPASDAPASDAPRWTVGGYLQPQIQLRQDDPVVPADEDGVAVRRARLTAHAERPQGRFTVSADVEAELTPGFQLLDAYVSARACVRGGGAWRLDAGQVKAPVSRQALLSDSRLGFVDKAALASLAPDRQVGVLATLDVPRAPGVRIAAGVFDGEGRNQGGNVDQRFLYAGRIAFAPLGAAVGLAESNLGGDYLVVAGSAARQTRDSGDGLATETTLGVDVAFGVRGVSGTFEYLQVRHAFNDPDTLDYRANGVVAQLAYLVPVAALRDHLEVGVRWEEIDRNDTIPIVRRGDPDQSLRYFTGALNWYQLDHDLKLQVSASHIVEVEDRDVDQMPASYPNDTLLVQATFRID